MQKQQERELNLLPGRQKFIGHTLKRTYHTVLSASSVDEAVKAMQEN